MCRWNHIYFYIFKLLLSQTTEKVDNLITFFCFLVRRERLIQFFTVFKNQYLFHFVLIFKFLLILFFFFLFFLSLIIRKRNLTVWKNSKNLFRSRDRQIKSLALYHLSYEDTVLVDVFYIIKVHFWPKIIFKQIFQWHFFSFFFFWIFFWWPPDYWFCLGRDSTENMIFLFSRFWSRHYFWF